MSTYRVRDYERTYRRRSRLERIPPRVQALAVGTLLVGLFIAASWGDGPYEQPTPTVPLVVENPGPWSWWER